MKIIILHSEYGQGANYGLGTFLFQYITCLKQIPYLKIYVVRLFSHKKEFSIEKKDKVLIFHIPAYTNHYYSLNRYYDRSIYLMKLHIGKKYNNTVFIFNTLSLNNFIKKIHTYFNKSKIIYINHYLSDICDLNGDIQFYNKILKQKNSSKYQSIIENYHDTNELLNSIHKIICLSSDSCKTFNTIFKIPLEKITIIPNGMKDIYKPISAQQKLLIRKKMHIDNNEKIILFVGRVVKNKGIIPLISCFKKILSEVPECRLIIVGDLFQDDILKHSKNIWTKITYTGMLNFHELEKLYNIADIGIFPSYYEECSYVGIEMMMHGLPIVASDGYSVKNMFNNNENSIIAKIENITKQKYFILNLVEALLLLLKSNQLREDLSKKARNYYLEHYSLDRMIQNYNNFWNDFIKKFYPNQK